MHSKLEISRSKCVPWREVEEIVATIFYHPYLLSKVIREGIKVDENKMPPPVEPWPSRELPDRVMGGTQGNYRKGFDGDLKKCELMELVQYRCEVDRPEVRNSPVRCWPVVRLFRR